MGGHGAELEVWGGTQGLSSCLSDSQQTLQENTVTGGPQPTYWDKDVTVRFSLPPSPFGSLSSSTLHGEHRPHPACNVFSNAAAGRGVLFFDLV